MGNGCFYLLLPELLCWHSSEVGLWGTQGNGSRQVLRGKTSLQPCQGGIAIHSLSGSFPHELGSSQREFLLQEMIWESAVTSRGRDMFGHLVTFQCPWVADISHLVFLPDTKRAKSETTQRKEFSMAMLESHTYWKTIQITGIFFQAKDNF